MFLTAGMRIVASATVGLGMGSGVMLLMHILSIPAPAEPKDLALCYALLACQVIISLIGIGLFRMMRLAWILFWVVGSIALGLAWEHQLWHASHRATMPGIPFYLAAAMSLWFVPSAICVSLPSSRKFFFNEPDNIWMHKRVFREHAEHLGSVSGRPRKPVGINFVAWIAEAIALGIFVFAMSKLAEPEGYEGGTAMPETVIALLIGFAVCAAVAGFGLMRTKLWGWFGTMGCAVVAIGAGCLLLGKGNTAGAENGLRVSPPMFLLCLVWCGSGILYLLLPSARRPFFSRRRSSRPDRPR